MSEEQAPAPKPKYQIRKAKITDIPQLVDMIEDLYKQEIRLGNRTTSISPDQRRGGIMIQLGIFHNNPDVRIEVCNNGDNRLIGFIIGIVEPCSPTDECLYALKIWMDYMKDKTLAGPKVLAKMWENIYKWGKNRGIGYAYCHILPKNIPSIRAAKHVGFRHHYTQFLLTGEPVEQEDN